MQNSCFNFNVVLKFETADLVNILRNWTKKFIRKTQKPVNSKKFVRLDTVSPNLLYVIVGAL